jgi:hypothetical protein
VLVRAVFVFEDVIVLVALATVIISNVGDIDF